MVHEYALDPKVVARWARSIDATERIFEAFGVGQPRLFAEFPALADWKSQAIDYFAQAYAELAKDDATSPDSFQARFSALVQHVVQSSVPKQTRRANAAYDPPEPWLDNAVREDRRLQFAAMICDDPKGAHPRLLRPSDMTQDNPLWTRPRTETVEKTPEIVANLLKPLLRISSHVVFVDPFFNPCLPQYKNIYRLLFDGVKEGRFYPGASSPRIEIACENRKAMIGPKDNQRPMDYSEFRRACLRELSPIIPSPLRVEVGRFLKRRNEGPSDRLHGRWVLTELGGVNLQYGTDASDDWVGTLNDLHLMDKKPLHRRWNQYSNDCPAFDHVPEEPQFTVIGEGR